MYDLYTETDLKGRPPMQQHILLMHKIITKSTHHVVMMGSLFKTPGSQADIYIYICIYVFLIIFYNVSYAWRTNL